MSLNFIDHKNQLQVTQVSDVVLRLYVSKPLYEDHNTIIFDLTHDDVVILMRHLTAYIETGELMRV